MLADKDTQEKKAIGIIRVSSDEQARKGASIESQEEWIKRIAQQMNLEMVEIIKDVVSGEVFPKKYFNKILDMVEKENAKYILVYALDRFARNLPYGAYLLEKIYEIGKAQIITSTGIFDLNNRNHRVQVFFSLLISEMEQGSREERTFRGMVTKLKRGEWPLSPPFGYERVDCKLRLIPEYIPVIRFTFDTFIRVKSYAATARLVNNKYGKEMGFELTGCKIKKIVQDKVYLGFLRWNGMLFGEGEEGKPSEKLKVIDNKTFDEAQTVVKGINQKYSRGNNAAVENFIEKYGVENVIEVFNLKPACPRCNSYNTQRNGREKINGTVHLKYICKKCGHQFRFPSKKQLKRIENLFSLLCKKCDSRSQFILEKNAYDFWELICKNCGNKTLLQEYCDRHSKRSSDAAINSRKEKGVRGNEKKGNQQQSQLF